MGKERIFNKLLRKWAKSLGKIKLGSWLTQNIFKQIKMLSVKKKNHKRVVENMRMSLLIVKQSRLFEEARQAATDVLSPATV